MTSSQLNGQFQRLPVNTNGKKLFVTVIGGGNSTPIFATLAKLAGHDVAILTRKPQLWSKTIGFDNQDVGYLDGVKSFTVDIDLVTDDPALCIPQSDLIVIAGVPVHHNPEIFKEKIAPHLDREREVMIGTVCAYGGFHWVAADILGKGKYILTGAQLIPWCCGTIKYASRGVVFGAKRMLRIPSEDGLDKHGCKAILQNILQIPDIRTTDFLASTLWPNNPSLHPPILYGLFKDWDGKTPYNKDKLPVRMYAELTKESARYLEELDQELNAIIDRLKVFYPENKPLHDDFHLKACIEENYISQVGDASTLESVVRTCTALSSHNLPYTEVSPGKIVPTLAHKFFETDLPFGLCVWKDIALMIGVETPLTDAMIEWNQKLIGKEYIKDGKICGSDAKECILPSAFGLTAETLNTGLR